MIRPSFTVKESSGEFNIKKFCDLPNRACNVFCRTITAHTETELLAAFYKVNGFFCV